MKSLLTPSIVLAIWASQAAVIAQLPDSGPRLSDAEFFSLLDFSRPELAPVRRAVRAADWPAARRELAAYMRQRSWPEWDIDPQAIGRNPEYIDLQAEAALEHRATSIGIEWQFEERIDWAFNPTTREGSPWPRNHEWTWQLSRHQTWVALARAFYATGDEKYAQEFVRQMRSWVRECPVPIHRPANHSGSQWRTIEAGIRAGRTWPEIFPRFLAAEAFDEDALVLMLKSYVEHAQYLMAFHTRNNWLTMEANGLYHAGALFPEFKPSKLWREAALNRLYRELDTQVYPDGVQVELAPAYHGVAINNFLGSVRLQERTGFPVQPDYVAKMEKMFDYLLHSMQPNGTMPPLNDSDAQPVTGYMRQAAGLFPEREDFRWAASLGREGRPPQRLSFAFPYAGQYFLRTGWDPDAAWMCMDGGPFGAGHQHEDKLSVLLTAFGKPLLVEGGKYAYDDSDWRRYVLGSRAHNVVLVDGRQQRRRREPQETHTVQKPLPHIWESNDAFDHAAAVYDEGWGPEGERLVRHTRHVFFLKPDLFVIADELRALDDKPHVYEALFHLDSPELILDGLRVATRNEGPNLTVVGFGADSVRAVRGETDPVQGWVADPAAGYGGIRPVSTAIYRKEGRGRTTLLYALQPTRGAAAYQVTDASLVGDTLRVRLADGGETMIRFRRIQVREGRTGRARG